MGQAPADFNDDGSVAASDYGAFLAAMAGNEPGLPPGTGLVSVPDVVGLTQSAASTAITGAGLVVGTVTPQSSATVPGGEGSREGAEGRTRCHHSALGGRILRTRTERPYQRSAASGDGREPLRGSVIKGLWRLRR